MSQVVTRALFAAVACFAVPAVAGPCPPCPAGCVPEGYVEQVRDGGETSTACPEGCLPLDRVRSMRERPACEAGVAPPEAAPVRLDNARATRNRVVVGPSALGVPDGETTITGYAGALWEIEHGFGDHLQVGGFVVLPVVVAGIFPSVKLQTRLSDLFSVGGGVMTGFATVYAGPDAGTTVWLGGGHVEATLHTGNHILNLTVMAGTGAAYWDNNPLDWSGDDWHWDMADGAVLLPALGYRWAFHRDWSVQAEVTVPLLVRKGYTQDGDELGAVLIYGFRGHGELLYGDIGFVMPFYREYLKHIWKYTPLGIPYFSIGFKF